MTLPVVEFNFETIRDDFATLGSGARRLRGGRAPEDARQGVRCDDATSSVANGSRSAEDERLLDRLRVGDERALHEVFDQYLLVLVRFADATMGTQGGAAGDAGDVVSDVLVSLWERRAELTHVRNVRAYLYRAVRNRALNQRRAGERSSERYAAAMEAGEYPGLALSSSPPDVQMEHAEQQRIVWRAVRAMREPMRTVAVLRWSHGLSFADIADVVGISENVARVNASRALSVLRATLPDLLR